LVFSTLPDRSPDKEITDARWNTDSAPVNALLSEDGFLISAVTISMSSSSSAFLLDRTTARTERPLVISSRTRTLPMNPPAPVTTVVIPMSASPRGVLNAMGTCSNERLLALRRAFPNHSRPVHRCLSCDQTEGNWMKKLRVLFGAQL